MSKVLSAWLLAVHGPHPGVGGMLELPALPMSYGRGSVPGALDPGRQIQDEDHPRAGAGAGHAAA